MSHDEENQAGIAPVKDDASVGSAEKAASSGENEVFADSSMRQTGWVGAAIFMLKMTFGAGVLSLPSSLYELGAVAGVIFLLFWGSLNTYMAALQGRFKIEHPAVHTVVDSAGIAAMQLTKSKLVTRIVKDVVEFDYILTWVLAAGLMIVGMSIGLNAVSTHATCSVVFGFISFITVATFASIRKIENLAWISWVGFGSVVAAVMTVLIATAIRDRPAAAPQEGDFDLGFSAFPVEGATFASAWAASLVIFASSGNTSGFVPVISEMRKPKDFFKSLYYVMGFITTCYTVIGMVMFRFAGKWLASPSLGSAGRTIKIVAYALAIPGLIAGAMICIHVGAKSLFVRFLRGSKHLDNSKSWQHWAVWLGCTYGVGLVSWLIAESVPFFGDLLTVVAALGFGPLGICLPVVLWFCLNEGISKKGLMGRLLWVLHMALFLFGVFVTVSGTYAAVVQIKAKFDNNEVGKSFQCEDNSNSVASD